MSFWQKWDPKKKKWLVFGDTDNNGYANGQPQEFSIYEDAKEALGKGIKSTSSSEGDSTGANAGTTSKVESGEVDIETGQVKKKGTTYQDMQENTVQISDIVDKVTDPETWAGTIGGDTRGYSNRGANTYITKKADGGRIGYMDGSDPEATELDMLNKWWRDQLATAWKE